MPIGSHVDKEKEENSVKSKAAPFLRWAGGKRQLLDVIVPALAPIDKTNRFFEPFVGGGAVMFRLGDLEGEYFVQGKQLVINDINPELIATYTAIRDEPEALLEKLKKLSMDVSKNGFEKVKLSQPSGNVNRAARFIYLNKTCFNGLWRVNSKGEFNVPWGKLSSPQIYNKELILACSERLQKSKIRCVPFTTAVSDASEGDMVYLDPPYIPLSSSASFSKYTQHDFSIMDQYALAGTIRGLTDKGVRVMLSNSDTPLSRKIFGSELSLWGVSATRSISAASSSRGKVHEIVGVNYELKNKNIRLSLISQPDSGRVVPT